MGDISHSQTCDSSLLQHRVPQLQVTRKLYVGFYRKGIKLVMIQTSWLSMLHIMALLFCRDAVYVIVCPIVVLDLKP